MDKPPFGYYLRKRFYSKERWDRYIASLDWGDPKPLTPPAPLAVIRPMTAEERMQRAYEKAKEQWLAEQVLDYSLRTYKDYMEHEDRMKALLEVQPFRDV